LSPPAKTVPEIERISMIAMKTFFKFSLSLLSKRIKIVLCKIISQVSQLAVEEQHRAVKEIVWPDKTVGVKNSTEKNGKINEREFEGTITALCIGVMIK
jgi:hypothetical protein